MSDDELNDEKISSLIEKDEVIEISSTSIEIKHDEEKFKELANQIKESNWLKDNVIDAFLMKVQYDLNDNTFLFIPCYLPLNVSNLIPFFKRHLSRSTKSLIFVLNTVDQSKLS